MGYSPIHIESETELNKVRKNQKSSKEPIKILFVSLWDKWCQDLVEKISTMIYDYPIYIVNSFDTPHSFVIFNTTKVPQLVILKEDNILIEDYLPNIYSELSGN